VLPTLRDDVVPLMPLFALFVWAMSATLRHPRTGAVAKDSRTGLQALRAHVAGTPMLFWAAAAAGPLASGLFLRLYPGGWMNVLLAAAPFVALLGALAFDALRPAATGRPAGFVAAGLLIAQFACLADLPASVVPSAEDREAGERVVAAIRADAGEVLVLAHPDLARRAGKAGSVHEIMLLDVRALGDSSARRLERELLEGFVSRRWSAIVLDHGEEAEWPFRIAARDYAVAETLAIPRDAFWTKSGARTRPETIWRPRPSR
jgi:hypothetical protein